MIYAAIDTNVLVSALITRNPEAATAKVVRLLFVAVFVLSFLSLHAQDILVRKGGEVENVKVLEVSPTEVRYKKSDNPDGPVFVEKRLNLYSVKYQNGEVQTFIDDSNENEGTSIYKGYGKEKKRYQLAK